MLLNVFKEIEKDLYVYIVYSWGVCMCIIFLSPCAISFLLYCWHIWSPVQR